jgi:hypothetical protein
MTKQQSRTMDASTTTKSARVLGRLDRAIEIGRESVRIARLAASIARPRVNRLQVSSSGSLSKDKLVFETRAFREGRTAADGSGRASGGELLRSETDDQTKNARAGSRWHRATAMVNAGVRVFRQITEVHGANMGGARLDARGHVARMLVSSTNASRRARDGTDTRQPSFGDAGLPVKVRVAPSIRGVMPPSGVSQREFALPTNEGRVSRGGSGRATITLNSSPTVVINAAAGGAVRDDVIGALRAHREELFDQLKRESARRERAQF